MKKGLMRLGEILVKKGMITEAQLHDALLSQKLTSGFLGTILVSKGVIGQRQLVEALSEQFDLPLIDLKTQQVDMELSRKFSSSLIVDHKCFPLRADDMSVTVAITNPLNAVALSKVEEEAGSKRINWVLAGEDDMKELIQKYRQNISLNIQRMLKKGKES